MKLNKGDFNMAKELVAMLLAGGQVTVNGETELQRGKKLHDGDVFSYDGETVKVVK